MDGEFSPVRPDGASGRVRWQHWKIQAPRMFFFGASGVGGILLITFLLLLKEK